MRRDQEAPTRSGRAQGAVLDLLGAGWHTSGSESALRSAEWSNRPCPSSVKQRPETAGRSAADSARPGFGERLGTFRQKQQEKASETPRAEVTESHRNTPCFSRCRLEVQTGRKQVRSPMAEQSAEVTPPCPSLLKP